MVKTHQSFLIVLYKHVLLTKLELKLFNENVERFLVNRLDISNFIAQLIQSFNTGVF